MSDYGITIASKQFNYPNPEEKAREILSYLISRDIVKNITETSRAPAWVPGTTHKQ